MIPTPTNGTFTKPICYRATMRGLKRCPSCGKLNGQRSLVCGNENCELRKRALELRRPFDAVQLVTHTQSRLYSVRSKERHAQPRNFVQITEVTLSLELNSAMVSRNAVCFVDTCKFDANDVAGNVCKHVKACMPDTTKPLVSLPQADVYAVSREVLWNLNISVEQKQRLWDLYKMDEQQVPAVQRLNETLFAVKCTPSKIFPAGRLHVIVMSNSQNSKKCLHSCACKKLKIIVEPDNSVVMQEEICDHLLLVLASILSTQNGKTIYGNFTNALISFWMPAALETPVVDSSTDAFYELSINIGGNFGDCDDQTTPNDIFIFGDEFLGDDKLPDFCDTVLESNLTTACNGNNGGSDLLRTGDPNLVSSCNLTEEDIDIQFNDITALTSTSTNAAESTHLELSDCNIELMDQFQLTDQIDLCSTEIALPSPPLEATRLFESSRISVLAPQQPLTTRTDQSHQPIVNIEQQKATTHFYNAAALLKSNQILTQLEAPNCLPPIELPTIAVVKERAMKASEIVAAVKTRKFPQIPAKRAIIVNNATETETGAVANDNVTAETEPALVYSAWLDHVIERINESIEITQNTEIVLSFNVHEEIFAHFSKSFSMGIKRRMPNNTVAVKSGKHKGLVKYTWYFSTESTVRRIFSSKNLAIEIERAFQRNKEGDFVPFVRSLYKTNNNNDTYADLNYKRVYPKFSLYKSHIWFECSNVNHKTGIKLDWMPNAYPKSHFGIMNIQFSLGICDPQNNWTAIKMNSLEQKL